MRACGAIAFGKFLSHGVKVISVKGTAFGVIQMLVVFAIDAQAGDFSKIVFQINGNTMTDGLLVGFHV